MKTGYLATYLRISDEDRYLGQEQEESISITSQRKVLQFFINKEKELSQYPVKEFLDDGFSGVNFNRPGIQELLKEVREGKISCIIVKDLSRLGRNYIEVGDYIEQIFPFLGVRVISVTDNYDSLKNPGGIEIGFKNLIHDLYSRDLSKKIKSVKKMYQEKGLYSGGDAPYGYKKPDKKQKHCEYQPDEAAAQIVREMFMLAAQGYTTGDIAIYLNDKAIPTPGVYKNQATNENYILRNHKRNLWTATQVRDIILNETYIGTFICRKSTSVAPREVKRNDKSEYIKYENAHEALIDKELFDAAGKSVTLRGKRGKYKKNENPHALKGKVKCGHCGYSMNIDERNSKVKFYCRMGNSCGSHLRIEAALLDTAVLQTLQKQIIVLKNHGDNKVRQMPCLSKVKDKKRHLEMKLEHCKSCRMILYRQWKETQITKEEYFLKRDEHTQKQIELENELKNLDKEISYMALDQSNSDLNGIMQNETVHTLTKDLADKLIDRIEVYAADRIEITWKFQNEYDKL